MASVESYCLALACCSQVLHSFRRDPLCLMTIKPGGEDTGSEQPQPDLMAGDSQTPHLGISASAYPETPLGYSDPSSRITG